MFICRIFGVLSICAGAVLGLAKPLQIVNEDTLSLPNLIDSAFKPNVTNSTPTSEPSANFNVHCNGTLYGFNLDIADCERAADSVIPDAEQLVWADRHLGSPGEFFPLPFLVFGDNAKCMVKTFISGDGPTARASLTQVRNAAAALSFSCSAGLLQGGIATNIGGDNNLAVTLSKYEPNVRCGRSEIFKDSPYCGDILTKMPASTEMTRFGPEGSPGVQESLPQLFYNDEMNCFLRLYSSTGRVESASWYSIWEAAESMFALCARERKSGSARGLGADGGILATLTGLPPSELRGNSSRTASE